MTSAQDINPGVKSGWSIERLQGEFQKRFTNSKDAANAEDVERRNRPLYWPSAFPYLANWVRTNTKHGTDVALSDMYKHNPTLVHIVRYILAHHPGTRSDYRNTQEELEVLKKERDQVDLAQSKLESSAVKSCIQILKDKGKHEEVARLAALMQKDKQLEQRIMLLQKSVSDPRSAYFPAYLASLWQRERRSPETRTRDAKESKARIIALMKKYMHERIPSDDSSSRDSESSDEEEFTGTFAASGSADDDEDADEDADEPEFEGRFTKTGRVVHGGRQWTAFTILRYL